MRRKYLAELSEYTGRATIVYATCWLENKQVPSESTSVNPGDVQGFMEAVSNLDNRDLDLIITSPGGRPEAAESIMAYLRTKFDHIRAIIPVAAMSAATMMALACDEIVMADHSQLGPIDPQFTVVTPEGPRIAPGQAILDQFELAKEECQDPKNLGAWLPMLRSLLPGLIAQCTHARVQAEAFVSDQLETYMFKGDATKAGAVAAWFADFNYFKSHGRPVKLPEAVEQGLVVTRLEDDDKLQDLCLSVHHAIRHTFNDTPAVKLIENHTGRAYVEMNGQVMVQPSTPSGPVPGPQPDNRQARRKAEREQNKKNT